MKKLFSVTLLLLGSLIYSQNSEVKLYDFKLKDKELTWYHVYDSDLNANDLKSNLIKSVSSSNSLTNLIDSENRITFNVKNDIVDFKSFGGKWGNTSDFVKYPQNYSVEVKINDYQYSVSIANINVVSKNSLTMRIAEFSDRRHETAFVDLVSRKKNTEFGSTKSIKKGINYIHQHYLTKFNKLPSHHNKLK